MKCKITINFDSNTFETLDFWTLYTYLPKGGGFVMYNGDEVVLNIKTETTKSKENKNK